MSQNKSKISKGRRKSPVRKPARKRKKVKVNIRIVLALLLAVLLVIYFLYPKDDRGGCCGVKVPAGYRCYGIDISKYQPDIDWSALKVMIDDDGYITGSDSSADEICDISFVFMKATEGTSLKDECFKRHWENAGKAGIRRGAYHFFLSSKSAEQQARHFISTVGELTDDDLPPVLDIETIHKGCSEKTLNEKALKWLQTVENHYGIRPIVYSSASFINDILSNEITDRYPIWVAHYETDKPECDNWHIWQFADMATVSGIAGNVDLNVTTERVLESL